MCSSYIHFIAGFLEVYPVNRGPIYLHTSLALTVSALCLSESADYSPSVLLSAIVHDIINVYHPIACLPSSEALYLNPFSKMSTRLSGERKWGTAKDSSCEIPEEKRQAWEATYRERKAEIPAIRRAWLETPDQGLYFGVKSIQGTKTSK